MRDIAIAEPNPDPVQKIDAIDLIEPVSRVKEALDNASKHDELAGQIRRGEIVAAVGVADAHARFREIDLQNEFVPGAEQTD
jgi:hypothetical protein